MTFNGDQIQYTNISLIFTCPLVQSTKIETHCEPADAICAGDKQCETEVDPALGQLPVQYIERCFIKTEKYLCGYKFRHVPCRKGTGHSEGYNQRGVLSEEAPLQQRPTGGHQCMFARLCGSFQGLQEVDPLAESRSLLRNQLQPPSRCKNSISLCLWSRVAQQPGFFLFLFESPHTLIFHWPLG